MDHLPQTMISNQFEKVKIIFINQSNESSIGNIQIASNALQNNQISFDVSSASFSSNNNMSDIKIPKNKFKFMEDTFQNSSNEDHHQQQQQQQQQNLNKQPKKFDFIYSLDNGVIIKPNECYELDMWIRAPEIQGEHKFYFMFFYQDITQNGETNSQNKVRSSSISGSSHGLKYRVIRNEFVINTVPSIFVFNSKIFNSQNNMNVFVNLDIANKQTYTQFELVDLISLSDIWTVKPIVQNDNKNILIKSLSNPNPTPLVNRFESNDSFSQQFKVKINKRTEEIVSIVLKATPNDSKNEDIFINKSCFDSQSVADELYLKPNDGVLLNFMTNDLKKNLISVSKNSNYLGMGLVWRSKTTLYDNYTQTESNFYAYGILSFKIDLDFLTSNSKIDKVQVPLKLEQDILKHAKNSILVNCTNQQFSKYDSSCSPNLCPVHVKVELKNLSSSVDFEMVVIAKNIR
jgi:hypothetical protein